MSERDFSHVMKDALSSLAPDFKNFWSDIGKEVSRLTELGAAEMAKALFHGNDAFTPYGRGQYPPKSIHDRESQEQLGQEAAPEQQQIHERGGRE